MQLPGAEYIAATAPATLKFKFTVVIIIIIVQIKSNKNNYYHLSGLKAFSYYFNGGGTSTLMPNVFNNKDDEKRKFQNLSYIKFIQFNCFKILQY